MRMGTPRFIRELREHIGHGLINVPAVSAIILDEDRRVLLQRRSDNGRWSTIGGVVEPGESPAQAVVREAWEETSLKVAPERIIGVYQLPKVTYPNGDQICGM